MTFILTHWKTIGALVMLAALTLGAYTHGVNTTTTKYELQIAKYKESINDQIQKAKNDKARIEAEQAARAYKAALGYSDTRKRLSDALKRVRDAEIMSGHGTMSVAGDSPSGVPRTPADSTGTTNPVEVTARAGEATFYENAMMDTLQCSALIELVR